MRKLYLEIAALYPPDVMGYHYCLLVMPSGKRRKLVISKEDYDALNS